MNDEFNGEDKEDAFNPSDVTLECYEVNEMNKNYSILFPKYSYNEWDLINTWGNTPVTESQLVRFFNYSKKAVNATITKELNNFTNDWKAFNTSFKSESIDGIEETQEYKNFHNNLLNTYNIPYFSDCEQLLKVYGMAFNMQQLRLTKESLVYIKSLKFRLEGWGTPLTMDEILERYCLNLNNYFEVMSQEHSEVTLMKRQLDVVSQNIYENVKKISNIEDYAHRLNVQFANHISNKEMRFY